MRKNISKTSMLSDSLGGSINSMKKKTRSRLDLHNSYRNSSNSELCKESKEVSTNLIDVFEYFDRNVHLKQTLIHICCNLNYVHAAKFVIERIIEGVGKYNDRLDEYLSKDKIQDSPSKVTILKEYLNRTDCFGVRAIHLASHNGNIKMIKLL